MPVGQKSPAEHAFVEYIVASTVVVESLRGTASSAVNKKKLDALHAPIVTSDAGRARSSLRA